MEKNPVSTALLGVCGVLVLAGLVLTLAWSGDIDSGEAPGTDDSEAPTELVLEMQKLGPLRDYDVVNNRPLFNETRRPMAEAVDATGEEPEIVVEQEVAERPRVRLTGVVITPDQRVVTLTPEEGGEAVVISEGMPLDGDYVGWSVDRVQPRRVSLRSDEGERFNVELAVHDAMIEAPPEPEPPAEAVDGDGEAGSDENRSRADEIRERIRERREQLRAEAEAQSEEQEDDKAFRQNAYQDAIRAMMQRGGDKEEEEDSGDE